MNRVNKIKNRPEIPDGMTPAEYLQKLELKIQQYGITYTDYAGNTYTVKLPPKREGPTVEELVVLANARMQFAKEAPKTKRDANPPKAKHDVDPPKVIPTLSQRDLVAERLRQRIKNAESRDNTSAAIDPTNIAGLPMWPEAVRGIPNAALRSALFGAIKRGKRAGLYRERITTIDGLEIFFTGFRLDQTDFDVWSQCLHDSRTKPEPAIRIDFSGRDFLRTIGRSGSGQNIKWLADVLVRLVAANVEVREGQRGYVGSLLNHGAWDEATGRFVVEINPHIAKLYGDDGWSSIEFGQRQALKGQPLAQWLHGFYSTHTHPYAYKVETLHRLCGSENSQLRDFRRELREAAAKVAAVTGWAMTVDEDDLLQVRKRPRKKASIS